MRYIQLKVVPIESNEFQKASAVILDYKAMILGWVSSYPEGALIEEIRRSTKLHKKVRSANPDGLLKLEDAEHEIVVKKLKAMRWANYSDEIVEFCDAVENAPESEQVNEQAATAAT